MSPKLSRRDLLKSVAGLAGVAVLAACGPKAEPTAAPAKEEPTAAPAKEEATTAPTVAPTAAPAKAESTVTMTFAIPGSGTRDMDIELPKKAGIKVEYQELQYGQMGEKLQLQAAGGTVPDMTLAGMDIVNNFRDAAFYPISDVLDTLLPNYKAYMARDPYYKSAYRLKAVEDQKIYGFYVFHQWPHWGWIYRKDLADKYGFDFTQPSTLDDWYNYIKKVQADDNTVLGASIIGSGISALAYAFKAQFGMHGTMGTNWDYWMLQDGKWVDGRLLPGFKDLTAEVARWYKGGAVDPAMATNTGWENKDPLWKQGKIVAGPIEYLETMENETDHPDPNFDTHFSMPPKGPTGEQGEAPNNCGWNYWSWAIGKDCKDLEGACRYFDFPYTCEGWTMLHVGVEGTHYTVQSDGKYKFSDTVIKKLDDEFKQNGTGKLASFRKWYGFEQNGVTVCPEPQHSNVNAAFVNVMQSEENKAAWDLLFPALLAQQQWFAPPITQEQKDEMAQINGDLGTYWSETWTQFLLGDKPMTDWDAFISEAEKLGIKRVGEIWNEAEGAFKRD